MRRFALALLLGFSLSVPAFAQTYFQPDVHGYGTQFGGAMFVYRDPGSQQIQVGIMDSPSRNTETIGTSTHMPQGRSDSYVTPPQSWSRSAYTRYPHIPTYRGYRPTYQRRYYGY